ncbi:hypothetical protein JZ751_012607 [Albula glossodonta]|uniref:Uncharacterized protein n=1 Tax=Albula glossodonta TaxID=121402 RepID=A0A8T2NUW9_9TELE|nr:hypothetical protein JZ751_012607 [Albula glossodonta]
MKAYLHRGDGSTTGARFLDYQGKSGWSFKPSAGWSLQQQQRVSVCAAQMMSPINCTQYRGLSRPTAMEPGDNPPSPTHQHHTNQIAMAEKEKDRERGRAPPAGWRVRGREAKGGLRLCESQTLSLY